VTVVLYEEDGYTTYRTKNKKTGLNLEEIEPKRAYIQIVQHSEADGDTVIGETNYSSLPIVPLWGNSIHTSALAGIKSMIDAYDLINSGLANDINDCAQIYWILGNASGMTQNDIYKFRDQLKFMHMAVVDTDNSSITPYTQEVPVSGRIQSLSELRSQIYEAFGALDVHTVAAGATNDHIDAAYQPMDEEADDFEYQIIVFIKQILKLIGIDDTPEFKRNRISNQMEQVQMVMLEAQYLDDETVLSKLPNIYSEEIPDIIARKNLENTSRFSSTINEGLSPEGEQAS
jgi:SPP1 family phage portal protein